MRRSGELRELRLLSRDLHDSTTAVPACLTKYDNAITQKCCHQSHHSSCRHLNKPKLEFCLYITWIREVLQIFTSLTTSDQRIRFSFFGHCMRQRSSYKLNLNFCPSVCTTVSIAYVFVFDFHRETKGPISIKLLKQFRPLFKTTVISERFNR